MKRIGLQGWVCTLAIMMWSVVSLAQDDQQREGMASCLKVAKDFYAWYVPYTQANLKHPAFFVAIERKSPLFEPSLLEALKVDAKAQEHSRGEIVGIDFDPFVGSQDPADAYELRNPEIRASRCFVQVWRNSEREKPWKPNQPDAVAELIKHGGHWQFANFQYHEGKYDLISVLAQWREERKRR